MKKILLLICSIVMNLDVSAQNFTAKWEKYPGTPKFSNFAAESRYYMWNVGAKGFYINHQGKIESPYWGTAASVNDTIGAALHQYMVNATIADWFTITDKSDAEDYIKLASMNLEEIREAINKRVRPTRTSI